MNLALHEVRGALLVVSQFTLYGDARRGRRPSFTDAASPAVAIPLYERFVSSLKERGAGSGIAVESGEFGARMEVELVGDGPVTHLLEMLRIPFRVIAPDVDEHVHPAEPPDHYVTRLSRAKATAVATRAPGELILAADTTVVLDGEIFGKPASPADAVAMLTRMQGRTH